MRIAINLFHTSPASVTGAFVYIQNILPALFQNGTENIYYLLGELETITYFKSLYGNLPSIRFHTFTIKQDLFHNPIRAMRKMWAKVIRDYQLREHILATEISDLVASKDITVYFSPASLYPRGLKGVHIVTTIHDLQ